jgi:hypothetical protein
MADVTGPISTLPGSSHHDVPDGMMCDDHPDRPAVTRLQGETDSFGSEMHDLCGKWRVRRGPPGLPGPMISAAASANCSRGPKLRRGQ